MKLTTLLIEAEHPQEIADGLLTAISAMGSMMFWAGNSGEYAAEQAKQDMAALGELLEFLPLLVRELMAE